MHSQHDARSASLQLGEQPFVPERQQRPLDVDDVRERACNRCAPAHHLDWIEAGFDRPPERRPGRYRGPSVQEPEEPVAHLVAFEGLHGLEEELGCVQRHIVSAGGKCSAEVGVVVSGEAAGVEDDDLHPAGRPSGLQRRREGVRLRPRVRKAMTPAGTDAIPTRW